MVLHAQREPLRLEDVLEPEPGPGQVKLRVHAFEDSAGCKTRKAGVVEKQGDQGRQESCGHAVARGVGEPKEPDPTIQLSPAVDIAADLD